MVGLELARRLTPALRPPALRPPRLLAALGTRNATRDAAAHGMVAEEPDSASSLLITTLPTTPGSHLRVAGKCASLTVKTNMETYVAEAWADLEGVACDARDVAKFDVTDGEILVSAVAAAARLTLTVPAAFEVSVNISGGACDVDVAGWLEGSVDVSTDSGNVSVKTVKGMLTRLRTGSGDVSVGSVDGNLDVETGDGNVALGKVVGEEVRAVAGGGGSLRVKAIYAKRTELRSGAAMQVSVLSAEQGVLSLGAACASPPHGEPAGSPLGDLGTISAAASKLGSLDGEIDVVVMGAVPLEIQAGEQLRRLRVVDASAEATGAAATLELHMPAKLAAEASLLAAALEVDTKLAARQVEPHAAAYDPKAAAASTPDRTPASAVALPAAAADAAERVAEELAAAETERAFGLGLRPRRVALSEVGPIQCAVEVVAPRRAVHVLLQDFFTRFKLNK